jgi:hypothetical protein
MLAFVKRLFGAQLGRNESPLSPSIGVKSSEKRLLFLKMLEFHQSDGAGSLRQHAGVELPDDR